MAAGGTVATCFMLLLFVFDLPDVKSTEIMKMEDNCHVEISMILSSIYQGILEFSTQRSFDIKGFNFDPDTSVCETDIEAWYNKPQIMFYFERFQLDCKYGYLEFLDGADYPVAISGLPNRMCDEDMPSGVFTTSTRTLRIRYTTVRPAEVDDVFKIVFTAFKDGSCANYDYECDNGRCISDEVSCNDHNSCGDNSSCQLNLSTYTILRIVGGCISFIVLIIALVVCVRKIRQRRQRQANSTFQPTVQYAPNQPQQVYMPAQAGTDMKGQPPYGAPPPGQPPYGAPPPGQPPYGALPPGQPPYGAPPPGQPPYGAPPPGQPPYGAPPPGQPPYGAPPPGQPPSYSGLYPQHGAAPYPGAEESKQSLLSSDPDRK